LASPDTRTVVIDPPTAEGRRLRDLTLDLAEALEAKNDWVLVGGLMVQLFSFEHDDDSRPTVDIDVLGGSRRSPAMTERAAQIILDRGGEVAMPPRSAADLGYRFELDGEVIEILGPDGLKSAPPTTGNLTTFQVEGGTQALARAETVLVSLGDRSPAVLRRPNLLGAILIKARVVAKKRDKFASDRQDPIRLLSYVDDPRTLATEGGLRSTERRWLGKIEALLAFEDLGLAQLFSAEVVERAQQAFVLLTA
jgi:hypothetical protein